MTAVPPLTTKFSSSFAALGVMSPTLARYMTPYLDSSSLKNAPLSIIVT